MCQFRRLIFLDFNSTKVAPIVDVKAPNIVLPTIIKITSIILPAVVI